MPRGVEIDPTKMRSLRNRALLTQEQLAVKASCSVDLIQKCERQSAVPGSHPRVDSKYLLAILDAINADLSDVSPERSRTRLLYERWESALWSGDIDAVMSYYHPEIVIELIGSHPMPNQGVYRGIDEARRWTELFVNETSDMQELEKSTWFLNDFVVIDLKCRFKVGKTGEEIETQCLRTFEFKDDLIIYRRIAADCNVVHQKLDQNFNVQSSAEHFRT